MTLLLKAKFKESMLYRCINAEQAIQGANGLFNSFHLQITLDSIWNISFTSASSNTRWAQMELQAASAEAY